jgi:hypothetical protein
MVLNYRTISAFCFLFFIVVQCSKKDSEYIEVDSNGNIIGNQTSNIGKSIPIKAISKEDSSLYEMIFGLVPKSNCNDSISFYTYPNPVIDKRNVTIKINSKFSNIKSFELFYYDGSDGYRIDSSSKNITFKYSPGGSINGVEAFELHKLRYALILTEDSCLYKVNWRVVLK